MVERSSRPRWAPVAALIAVAFGVVTIAAGGGTLLNIYKDRAAAGDIVPFVLWFNFVAGFAYVAAGVGLFLWRPWAGLVSAVIAVATVVVFFAFGIHILLGGGFEARTVGAMSVRSIVWIAIATAACRALGCAPSRLTT